MMAFASVGQIAGTAMASRLVSPTIAEMGPGGRSLGLDVPEGGFLRTYGGTEE